MERAARGSGSGRTDRRQRRRRRDRRGVGAAVLEGVVVRRRAEVP